MIKWKKINKMELERTLTKWKSIDDIRLDIPGDFVEWRELLIHHFQRVKMELDIDSVKGNEYQFDLRFGLALYTNFKSKFKFTESFASNNSFWIFLSVKVVPDIVFWRWGPGAKSRYLSSSRIWLKALYWYIHLSWQENEHDTYKILKNNTTDSITQLVERSGTSGYRVLLCRQIMKYFSNYIPEKKGQRAQFFRQLMKYNTARLEVIEPALYEGEEEGYVKDLFNQLVTSN